MAITPYAVNLEGSENPNVAGIYKNWMMEEIRADLDTKRTGAVMIFMNLSHDFNKASGIRALNAFSGAAAYIVGNRKYNRRGTVGTHNYEHIFHADTLEEVIKHLKSEGYTIVAVDNIPEHNPKNIWDFEAPEKTAFVFGEEQLGLSSDDIEMCDDMVYINQTGSVRSLNVAQAAACVLSEYTRQHRF